MSSLNCSHCLNFVKHYFIFVVYAVSRGKNFANIYQYHNYLLLLPELLNNKKVSNKNLMETTNVKAYGTSGT